MTHIKLNRKTTIGFAVRVICFMLIVIVVLGTADTIYKAHAEAELVDLDMNVIENYPFSHPEIEISNVEFEHKWVQSFYDWAYSDWEHDRTDPNYPPVGYFPQGTSGYYNGGVPQPEHITMDGSTINFFGYQSAPYIDAVFTDNYSWDSFEFDFNPVNMLFHCCKRSGFWINSSISPDGKISGYVVAIGSTNNALEETSTENPSYRLFKVTDMDIQKYNDFVKSVTPNNSFNIYDENLKAELHSYTDSLYSFPGLTDGSIELLADARSIPGVPALTDQTPKMHFRVVSSEDSFQVFMTPDSDNPGAQELLLFDCDTPGNTSDSFGFFMQNLFHSCSRLTYVMYDNLIVNATPKSETTEAKVFFKLLDTDVDIASPQTKSGNVGGEYKILPPEEIEGYWYFGADRESLDPIIYDANVSNNITVLYYSQAPTAEKTARVLPNGEESIGSAVEPIEVNIGDMLEYSITVNNINSPVINMHGGTIFAETLTVGITDILPNGVEYIESSHDGIFDNETGVVTWSLETSGDSYEIIVTVVVKVLEENLFVNEAFVNIGGHSVIETNKTYHISHVKAAFGFIKADLSTGDPLWGAEFNLYLWTSPESAPDEMMPDDIEGSDWELVGNSISSESGYVHFGELESGEYRLVETHAPEGYEQPLIEWRFTVEGTIINILPAVGDTSFADIDGSGTSELPYVIWNKEKIRGTFSFLKVDALTNVSLSGAKFSLYLWEGAGGPPDNPIPADLTDSEWTLVGTETSNINGELIFDNLNPGEYRLVEINAPIGYQLPKGQWSFAVDNNGEISILPSVGENLPPAMRGNGTEGDPYSIGNMKQYRLPEMGGNGNTFLCMGVGLLLLLNGAAMMTIMICRKRDNA